MSYLFVVSFLNFDFFWKNARPTWPRFRTSAKVGWQTKKKKDRRLDCTVQCTTCIWTGSSPGKLVEAPSVAWEYPEQASQIIQQVLYCTSTVRVRVLTQRGPLDTPSVDSVRQFFTSAADGLAPMLSRQFSKQLVLLVIFQSVCVPNRSSFYLKSNSLPFYYHIHRSSEMNSNIYIHGFVEKLINIHVLCEKTVYQKRGLVVLDFLRCGRSSVQKKVC